MTLKIIKDGIERDIGDVGDEPFETDPAKWVKDPNGGVWSIQINGDTWTAVNEDPRVWPESVGWVVYVNPSAGLEWVDRSLAGNTFKLHWPAQGFPTLQGKLKDGQPRPAISAWAMQNKASGQLKSMAKPEKKASGGLGALIVIGAVLAAWWSDSKKRRRR